MSNIKKASSVNFEKTIMEKVKSNEISMKPRWYFIVGSFSMIGGLIGLCIGVIFLINLTLFLLRQHGPMGQWRLELMLNSFPIWVPILAIAGIALGIWMLKKYDFSYKKHFWFIIAGCIISIFMTASLLDYVGFDDLWFKQGPMRRFYQQIENQNDPLFKEQGRGQMRNRQ